MIRRCKRCAFILGTKPGMYEEGGVCGACVNAEIAKGFDWEERCEALKIICHSLKGEKREYDCVIAVSGGKDSTVITKSLVEHYGMRPLLVTVTDEFTHTQAGQHNIKNIAKRFNCDHIIWRYEPETFVRETRKDFEQELHPLKWIEEKIYQVPVKIAKAFGIPAVFFGENSAFQYGSVKNLDYFHPLTELGAEIYYFFAFHQYNEADNCRVARLSGFKDLDDYNEWQRHGHIENYTQIDSIAYIVQLWTKYVKYGYQRVSDIACRFVRQGLLSREQALAYIRERDHMLDPAAKRDFCETVGIGGHYFDEIVNRHANRELVEQDANGIWRLKER